MKDRKPSKKEDAWERWVARALRADSLHEPPAGALRRALALGADLPRRRGFRWATILFDSAAEPQPAGVRGTTDGPRRLLFGFGEGEAELDLRVKREADGGLELAGQLLPPPAGARIEVRSGRTRREAALGEGGEFLLRAIPASASGLALEIRLAEGVRLRVDPVPLPATGR